MTHPKFIPMFKFAFPLAFTLLTSTCLLAEISSDNELSNSSARPGVTLYPYDLIRVDVVYEKDLVTEAEISDKGTVRLPYVGEVRLAGLTVQEGQQLIAKRFIEEDILVNPQVNIVVIKHAERVIQVTGQVNQPGPVLIPASKPYLTLTEVLSGARDVNRIANASDILVRKTNLNGQRYAFKVNYKKLRASTGLDDIILYEGDEVFVPESIF